MKIKLLIIIYFIILLTACKNTSKPSDNTAVSVTNNISDTVPKIKKEKKKTLLNRSAQRHFTSFGEKCTFEINLVGESLINEEGFLTIKNAQGNLIYKSAIKPGDISASLSNMQKEASTEQIENYIIDSAEKMFDEKNFVGPLKLVSYNSEFAEQYPQEYLSKGEFEALKQIHTGIGFCYPAGKNIKKCITYLPVKNTAVVYDYQKTIEKAPDLKKLNNVNKSSTNKLLKKDKQ